MDIIIENSYVAFNCTAPGHNMSIFDHLASRNTHSVRKRDVFGDLTITIIDVLEDFRELRFFHVIKSRTVQDCRVPIDTRIPVESI